MENDTQQWKEEIDRKMEIFRDWFHIASGWYLHMIIKRGTRLEILCYLVIQLYLFNHRWYCLNLIYSICYLQNRFPVHALELLQKHAIKVHWIGVLCTRVPLIKLVLCAFPWWKEHLWETYMHNKIWYCC